MEEECPIWLEDTSFDEHGTETSGDHGAGLDSTARRLDVEPAAVIDAALGGQLGTQLDEHFRLQFVEPAIEPAHGTAQVVLRQPKRGGDDRKFPRGRMGNSIERSFEHLYRKDLHACFAG